MDKQLSSNHLIATDLDRTLFPNGDHAYDLSMAKFSEIRATYAPQLAYVSGRNIEDVEQGEREFDAPRADFVGASVGTQVWESQAGVYKLVNRYAEEVRNQDPSYDVKQFRELIDQHMIRTGDLGLRLQGEAVQFEFKLSYYADVAQRHEILAALERVIGRVSPSTQFIWSEDKDEQGERRGLLDILPASANKSSAIRFIMKELGISSMDHLIYSGDSGNDIDALAMGGKAILVNNASPAIREEVTRALAAKGHLDRLVISSPIGKLNGNYVSGIITGLIEHGLLPLSLAEI